MLWISTGSIEDIGDDIEYVKDDIPLIRIVGSVDILVNKRDGVYHPASIEKAR